MGVREIPVRAMRKKSTQPVRFNTSRATQMAATQSKATTMPSLDLMRREGEAIHALPRPIPRMKEINTTAKACNEEPKMSANEREASNSRPMETAPVRATTRPAYFREEEG